MLVRVPWLLLVPALLACGKKEAPAGAASSSTPASGADGGGRPHVWRDVPPRDGGVRDAASSHENLTKMKDRLKAKVASGTADEREKKMLAILCKNLGDESCAPPDGGKRDPHGH